VELSDPQLSFNEVQRLLRERGVQLSRAQLYRTIAEIRRDGGIEIEKSIGRTNRYIISLSQVQRIADFLIETRRRTTVDHRAVLVDGVAGAQQRALDAQQALNQAIEHLNRFDAQGKT